MTSRGRPAIPVPRSRSCESCGSPLADDQRYCLVCGERAGSRAPALERLLARVRAATGPARGLGAADGRSAAPTSSSTRPRSGLALPSRPVSAALVALCLGFGVLLGHIASSRQSATLASSRSPLKVVLGASARSRATTTAPEAPSSASGEEAASEHSSEAEATQPAPAHARTPAKSPSPSPSSTGSSGSQEGSGGSQGASPESSGATPDKTLPAVKHVFVIMLSDEPYAGAFGPSSTAPYLAQTLEHKGKLLTRFDAVAHEELADEVALLSGQGPTAETKANCPNYTAIAQTGTGAEEQVLGEGCVYPASTQTLAGELTAKHLSWRAYVQGIDEAGAQAGACAHPALGQADPSSEEGSSSGPYATFRNPFVYFGSIVGSPACAVDDVGLANLKADLAHASRTPNFSYIVPDRCDDGNPTPCSAGAAAGLTPANAFLQQVVPEILASPAYKQNGLLLITVDEAPSSGEFADSSSCCGEPLFPNAPAKTLTGAPAGGGTVGALLLSPFIQAGTTSQETFNDFSLLLTFEELFGLKRLGYAALPAVKAFEPAMFSGH